MASFLILLTRSLIALLCLSSSVSSITLSKFLKRQINTVVVATSLSLPLAAHAVPLGLHSGCAYPACTSQLEILQSSAPGLVANDIKIAQVRALKDIQFALVQLTSLAQDKDYAAIRSSLRSQPTGSLRITARKVRNLVPAEGVSTYTASYSSMLEDVDDVDSLAGLRLRGESSDQSLNAAIEKAQKSYASFVDAVDKLVEVSAIAPASLPAVTATD